MAKPRVEVNRPANPQASGHDMNVAHVSGHERAGVSEVRGSLEAPSVGSLRVFARALVDLALQVLRDEKFEESEKEAA